MNKQGLWFAGMILIVCIGGSGCRSGENTSRLAFLYNQASISMREGKVSESLIREIQNLQELEVEDTEGTYITAYNQFLKEYEVEFKEQNNKNNWEAFKFVKFQLVYLDDDEIPELVIDDWGRVRFYTYCSGKVKELGEFWEYESIEYEEKTGIIRLILPEEYRWIRTYTETYYQLEDGEIKQIVQLYSDTWFNDDYIEHPYFEIDDNSVSEETFQVKKRELEEKYDFILIDGGIPVSVAPVLESYRTFLKFYAKLQKDKGWYEEPRFALIYLDGDEIPELLLIENDGHVNGVKVYTFFSDKVVQVGEFGSYGRMRYAKKEGIIDSFNNGSDIVNQTYYQLENGKAEIIVDFYVEIKYEDMGATEFWEYEMDGVSVSEEEYQSKQHEIEEEHAFIDIGYDDAIPIIEGSIYEALIIELQKWNTISNSEVD